MCFAMNKKEEINNSLEKNSNELSKNGVLFGLMELLKVKTILNYSDLRSTANWCRKNKVFIMKQGNKKYVNKWEFILSFHKQFIKHLKEKHDNWKEVFLGYMKGDLGNLLGSSKEEEKTTTSISYKPKNKGEASFLNKMKKI